LIEAIEVLLYYFHFINKSTIYSISQS